jgi:hypothetical protein
MILVYLLGHSQVIRFYTLSKHHFGSVAFAFGEKNEQKRQVPKTALHLPSNLEPCGRGT